MVALLNSCSSTRASARRFLRPVSASVCASSREACSIATLSRKVSIVRAITAMGHELGLSVTAEGIETEAQWQILADLGCDRGQGYLIARPMPAADATAFLQAEHDSLPLTALAG